MKKKKVHCPLLHCCLHDSESLREEREREREVGQTEKEADVDGDDLLFLRRAISFSNQTPRVHPRGFLWIIRSRI